MAALSLPRWLTPFSLVAETDVTPVVNPVHANQRVEKSFTIPKCSDDSIHDLQIEAPGLTVIRVHPSLPKDVVARIRVSSDDAEHIERLRVTNIRPNEVKLKYHARCGTLGHLVTEIDVPRAGDVHQVMAMCRGDVVITNGVLGNRSPPVTATQLDESTTLVSAFGARLFVAARDHELRLDQLILVCAGSGRIDIAAERLALQKDFAGAVLGRGRIDMTAHACESKSMLLCALGGGQASLLVTGKLHTDSLDAYQRGHGSVFVTASTDAAVECPTQHITTSGRGVVDMADVQSKETSVELLGPTSGVVRIRSPLEKLWVGGSKSSVIQHVGALPSLVELRNSSKLTEVEAESLIVLRREMKEQAVTVPTIASAFETPTSLEKPAEGWFFSALVPTVRALLPYDVEFY